MSKIETYEIAKDYAATLERNDDRSEVTVHFKKGDRWSYLVYGSEGAFLMRYKDALYVAYDDLIDHSQAVNPATEGTSNVDEWLKLKCANGAFGWLLMSDVANDPVFAAANVVDYGRAEDLNAK